MRSAIYFQQIIDFMLSGYGVIAMTAGILLSFALLAWPAAKWYVLGAALYLSSMYIGEGRWHDPTLVWPLEGMRTVSRQVGLALVAILLLPALLQQNGWRWRIVSGPLLLYFLFHVFVGIRFLPTSHGLHGVLFLISALVVLLSLGWGLGKFLQTLKDFHSMIAVFVGVALAQITATFFQLSINPSAILHGSRLWGTTPNPQALALFIIFLLPFMYYIILSKSTIGWRRISVIILTGILVLMLVWTGSRTGALAGLVGVLVFFRLRLGKLALVSVCVAVVLFLLTLVYEDSLSSAHRYLHATDTRTAVWAAMLSGFYSNPIIGDVGGGTEMIRENGYLAILAGFGVVGGAIFLVVLAWLAASLKRLWDFRHTLGEHSVIVDALLSFWASVLVAALFENYFTAIGVFFALMIYINLALLNFVRDLQDWSLSSQRS